MEMIKSMGGVEVYVVGFGSSCFIDGMNDLAVKGGGTFFESATSNQLEEAFLVVASNMGKKVALVTKKVSMHSPYH